MDVIRWLGEKAAAMYGRRANLKPDKDKDREYINRLLYSTRPNNRQSPGEYGRKLKQKPKPAAEPSVVEDADELRGDA